MNKVVTMEMLASELPEKVRGAIASDHRVEVTIRDLDAADDTLFSKGQGTFSQFYGESYPRFSSVDDVIRHIRAIRDGDETGPS